jgi:hypothetical protein
MKNYDNSPMNGTDNTARLTFLTGGPLDSLLAQLAGARVSPPPVTAQLPVTDTDRSDASKPERPTPTRSLVLANHP